MPRTRKQEAAQAERPAKVQRIFELMASGMSARQACDEVELNWGVFMKELADRPELNDQYAKARESMLEKIASDIMRISDEPAPITPAGATDSGAVAQKRLQVDTRKWLLSKLAPKKYGDRLEVAGDASSPLQAAVTVSFVTAAKKGDE